ncbi:MAG: hypothetical protein OEW17_09505 [Gemmatimonadota bacterium]|nr:hypothetical protein [Gemmatimonadota bacterium]MDH4349031.1 hypothetical protein [Gemmatimonadota bacterium]
MKWCAEQGLRRTGDLPASRIDFPGGAGHRLRVLVAGSATEVIGLCYALMMTAVPDDEEEKFRGGLVWLQDWDIWSATTERVGHLLLTAVRGPTPEAANVRARPANLFEPEEFVQAHTILSLALLFQWDAHYVPLVGGFYAFLSHHGHIEVVTPHRKAHDSLLARFERGGYSPAPVGHV